MIQNESLLRRAIQNNEGEGARQSLLARKKPAGDEPVRQQGQKKDADQSQHLIEQAIDDRPFGLN